MKKFFKYWMQMVPVVLGLAAMMTSCSGFIDAVLGTEDTPVTTEPVSENVIKAGAFDVANGKIFHYIDVNRLQDYKMSVAALKDVVVQPEDNEYFDLKVEEINGERYIVPYQKKDPEEDLTVKRVKIYPKGMPELARNVLFVYDNTKKAKTRVDNEIEIAYSQTLGMGTNIYGEVGNIIPNGEPVFYYNEIMDLGQKMYTGESRPSMVYQEIEGQDYKKTIDTYAWNVGVNITSSKMGSKLSSGIFNSKSKGSAASLNIKANLGHSGSETNIENREYYMKTCLAVKNYISLNVNSIFDPEYNIGKKTANINFGIITKVVNKKLWPAVTDVDSTEFNWRSFYKTWGTDVIVQGVYGGYLQYTYSRMQSCYDTTSKWDASASLTYTEPKSNLSGIMGAASVLTGKTAKEQYSAEFSGSWSNEDYQSTTKANSYLYIVGGELSASEGGTMDVNQWLTGINNSNEKLALISYRNPSNGNSNTEESCLLQIEMVIDGMIRNYELVVADSISERDKDVIKRAIENGQKLYNHRYDYIAEHAVFQKEADPLVIADFRVMRGDEDRPDSEPKSFIGTDARGKKHIYYPLMNNDYAPNSTDRNKHGYALDATTEDYAHCENGDWDLYFWYALEPASECDGLIDIKFDTYYDWKKHYADGDWIRLCGEEEHEHSRVSDDEDEYPDSKKTTPYGKFAGSNTPNSDKIKAIAIIGKWEPNHPEDLYKFIYASTGGSELHFNHTESELDDFKDYWTTDYLVYTIEQTNTFHPTESYEDYTCGKPIHLLLSKKSLNISNVKDICHPKFWDGTDRNSKSRSLLDDWIGKP